MMKKLRNEKGFSLVEALVAVGLLCVIGLGIAAVLENMHKELRWANSKFEQLEHKGVFTNAMSNLPNCSCLLKVAVSPFNSLALPADTSVSAINMDCSPGAPPLAVPGDDVPNSTTHLKIGDLRISKITNVSPDRFRGKLHIDYKMDWTTRSMAPFELDILFRTDVASPASAKKLEACEFIGVSSSTGTSILSGSCPPDQFVVGFANGGFACSAVAIAGTASNSSGHTSSNPGPGCTGDYCKTGDFGPCVGNSCRTNGNSCQGDNCSSCGGGSCTGQACCSGPSCTGCPVF
jgi:hypothetical protein